MHTIDSLATLIKSGGAAERNERAWGIYTRSYIWPIPYYAKSYDDAVNYLKTWVGKRLQYLDAHLLPPRVVDTDPISVASGWNADIVAESLPANNFTTATIDGVDRALYAETLRGNGGLPRNRTITSAHEQATFQLAPYDELNTLSLRDNGQQGTLEFAFPIETSELFVLATSGNGDSQVRVRLNYSDGTTSDAGVFTIRDWSVRKESLKGDEAVTSLGNIQRANNSYSSDNHYCLFDFSIPLETKPLQSVTFTSTNYAYASIMALSALKASTTDVIAITGRNASRLQPAIYNLRGMRVGHLQQGINIIRTSDGKIKKVIKK